METISSSRITDLLEAWSQGDSAALDELIPVVYSELHRVASRQLRRERPNHTLQTTALVNEAYVRLIDQTRCGWENRTHFFAVAASVMRRILVDYARSQRAAKRGGGTQRVSLKDDILASHEHVACVTFLDEALNKLARLDARKSQIVELRFFGGLTIDEVASVLHVSPMTVMRDWAFAKAWLHRELSAH